MDGVEVIGGRRVRAFEDASPYRDDPEALRALAARDGFLFFRALVPREPLAALRARVLDHAARVGWLDPDAGREEARAAPGKRIGGYQDPDWINLQVAVQTNPELWEVGDCVAIHRVLRAVEGRSSYLNLSTANTCRIFSPHPDTATQPHQDAHYVRFLGAFWTVWMPLGDCPRTLGALALLPGSHRDGLRDHAGAGVVEGGVTVDPDALWCCSDYRCGDAVMFGPHTLHCSLPNQSGDRLRLSADFRYGFWEEASAFDWRATAIRSAPEPR